MSSASGSGPIIGATSGPRNRPRASARSPCHRWCSTRCRNGGSPARRAPADIVFPNGDGNIENHANIANRGFYALQHATGIIDAEGKPKYGLHSLRHFFASWAIEQGFSAKRVQVLLGHSSIQMTFDVYGHLFPSLEDDHAKFAAGELAVVG